MDDFFFYEEPFDDHLTNLGKVFRRCSDKRLTLNWDKCHFKVKIGIVLGHIISNEKIEVDKAMMDLIANLHVLTCVKNTCRLLLEVYKGF